jgi:hypothetical protein
MQRLADLPRASTRELLMVYDRIMGELRTRGVARTNNNPTSAYGEWLAKHALGLELAGNSQAGFDGIRVSDGKRFEVKTARHNPSGKAPQFSAVRKLDAERFDFLVAIVLRADFSVESARVLTRDQFRALARFDQHTNSHVLHNDAKLRETHGIEDVTPQFQQAQKTAES